MVDATGNPNATDPRPPRRGAGLVVAILIALLLLATLWMTGLFGSGGSGEDDGAHDIDGAVTD